MIVISSCPALALCITTIFFVRFPAKTYIAMRIVQSETKKALPKDGLVVREDKPMLRLHKRVGLDRRV